MKKYLYLVPLGLLLASCVNDDSKLDDLIGDRTDTKEAPIEIAFPDTYAEEAPDEVPPATDETYNDYVESMKSASVVEIEYAEGSTTIRSSASGISITNDGAHVAANISTRTVKFVLSGTCSNGSLRVEGANRYQISLAGLQLTNPAGAVINNQCKKTLYIVAEDGTENTLSATGGDPDTSDAKGCIFSEGQIAFSGRGKLQVNSAFRNAIASDDYIFVRPGTRLGVNCTSGNGIKANDGVKINGGTLNISVNYDGGKGINSESFVALNGGCVTIINEGTTRLDRVPVSQQFTQGIDTVSCAGIKCDLDLTVSGGKLRVKCTGNDSKGLKTNTNYLQTGGSVQVVTLGQKVLAAPKCIKTDLSIDIAGGSLYAYSKHSTPLDSDGQISVYAYKRNESYLVEVGE